MTLIIFGIVLLVVLGTFYLKDHFRKPWLAQVAYSEGTMRLTIVTVALILFGGLIIIGEFFN